MLEEVRGGFELAAIVGQPGVSGQYPDGSQLDLAECRMLGELLGDLDGALAGVTLPGGPDLACPVPSAAATRSEVDGYAALISSLSRIDDFDARALAHLRWRSATLAELGRLRPDDEMTADPLRSGSEPATAAMHIFGDGDGLDLPRISAFAAGYRSVRGLADAQLADAVHRLWWDSLCSLWPLKLRYDHADTSCDHLFLINSARLQWWTLRREQVLAAFTSG